MKRYAILIVFALLPAYIFPFLIPTTQAQSVEERIKNLEDAIERIERKIDRILVDKKIETAPFWEELLTNQSCDQEKLNKEYFIICYHREWKIPVWVGYYLNKQNLKGDTPRTNDFRQDPTLHPDIRSTRKDYRRSKHDRGHMAPAAAFKRSKKAMSTTFLLSNMAPQTPQLNRAVWKLLEDDVRKIARNRGPVWVFTGNLFLDQDGTPIEPTKKIGSNKVAVPTHCFKVILLRDKDDEWKGYGFIMPNQKQRISGKVSDFMTSIDSLEKKTGIDFFATLPDALENTIEKNSSHWPIED